MVDDGPDPETRAVARRHGARYVAHDGPRGINVARNTAVDVDRGDAAGLRRRRRRGRPRLARSAAAGGRRRARTTSGSSPARSARGSKATATARAGARAPPITFLDLGPEDVDADARAGARTSPMRRSALERVGRFAEDARPTAATRRSGRRAGAPAGGRVRYVAAAGVDHRRAGRRRPPALARPRGLRRGRAARRFDARRRRPRRRSRRAARAGRLRAGTGRGAAASTALVMAAHSAGPLAGARCARRSGRARRGDDFLSGASGDGRRRAAARCAAPRDALLDARETVDRRGARGSPAPRRASRRAAACSSLGDRAARASTHCDAARAELRALAPRRRDRTSRRPARAASSRTSTRCSPPTRPTATTGCSSSTTTSRCRRGFLDRFLFACRALRPEARAARAPPALARRLGGHAPPAGQRGARDDASSRSAR